MKAAIINSAGEAAGYGNFPDPEAADDETTMRVLAAGIHPVVRSLAAGTHYGSQAAFPLVPGVDCVAQDEDGLVHYAGQVRSPWGTIAEQVAVRMALPLPDGADPVAIAGALNPGMSSWLPLNARAHVDGDLGTVIILGATGIAGRIAVQNAFALGAERVIGIGRNPERLAEVQALSGEPVALADGAGSLRRVLGSSSPSLILDYLWGAASEVVWEALEGRGLEQDDADIDHIQVGNMAGERASIPGSVLRSRRITVRGSGAGSVPVSEIMTQLPVLIQKVVSGEVLAPVEVFPLSRVDQAWNYTGPRRAVIIPD